MNRAELYSRWIEAKAEEAEAVERRRIIEDNLTAALEIAVDLEGSATIEDEGYKVKVTGRINRKVDAEAVQTIATEHGLGDYLSTLFRWKPEINATEWKKTDKSITDILQQAVTATPGRPSFAIERKE